MYPLQGEIGAIEAKIECLNEELTRLKRSLQEKKDAIRNLSEIEQLRRFRQIAGNRQSSATNIMAERENDEYWMLMDLTAKYVQR